MNCPTLNKDCVYKDCIAYQKKEDRDILHIRELKDGKMVVTFGIKKQIHYCDKYRREIK